MRISQATSTSRISHQLINKNSIVFHQFQSTWHLLQTHNQTTWLMRYPRTVKTVINNTSPNEPTRSTCCISIPRSLPRQCTDGCQTVTRPKHGRISATLQNVLPPGRVCLRNPLNEHEAVHSATTWHQQRQCRPPKRSRDQRQNSAPEHKSSCALLINTNRLSN